MPLLSYIDSIGIFTIMGENVKEEKGLWQMEAK